MNRLVCIFVVAAFVSVSDQVARFIRLPDGYWAMPSAGPSIQTRVPSEKDCGIKATIAQLHFGNVSRYIFSRTSDPNCEISTSIDKISDQGAVAGDAWYIKIPDDISYEAKCADQDVKRLIGVINAKYALATTKPSSAPTTPSDTLAPEGSYLCQGAVISGILACRSTNAGNEVAVYLDNSADRNIISWIRPATVSCPCDTGTKKYWLAGETPKPYADVDATNRIMISCSDLSRACIFAEDGIMWTSGNPPPIYLTLYPYCESEPYGCHMYLEHHSPYENTFLKYGKVVLNQSVYYKSERLVDLGHDSVYIKAAAISCSGCQNIRDYASFQCFMPEISAPAVTQTERTTTTNPTTTESTPRLTKATTTVAATTRTSTTTTPAQTTPTTKRTTTVKPTTKTTKKSTTPKRTSPTTPRPTTPLPKCAPAPDKSNHANIVLDYASPMTVKPLGAKATLSCGCTSNNVLAPGLRYEFWRMGAKSVTASKDTNGIKVSCANKIKLCMLTESKQEWIAGSKPPDYVVLYPFCNERGGCHMWSAHYPKGSEIMSGGSRFVSTGPPGNQGDDPEYMKVDAVSCGGCARIAASNKIVCELA